MLIKLLFTLLAFLSPNDAEGLRKTAPSYLDLPGAAAHAGAARLAGMAFDVDPDVLLAIAYRESRYQVNAIGPESGGRVSCGVMTPSPVARCSKGTLLGGYMAGARHFREWLDACHGNDRCAQLGYAGGYALLKLCETSSIRQCHAHIVINTWAARIRRSRSLALRS